MAVQASTRTRFPSTSKHALPSRKASSARNTDDGADMTQKAQYDCDNINRLVSNIRIVAIKSKMSVWIVAVSWLRNEAEICSAGSLFSTP